MSTSLLMSKVVDIAEARRRRENRQVAARRVQHDENRREYRLQSNETLFVQVVSCANHELLGTTLSCRALDVSASGLRIVAETALPSGCQLDLWIDNATGPGKFFLSSEVRWTKRSGGGYELGVMLNDGSATDIDEWKQLYA
ncbi:MAG: PilZ domain-containing protein [Pseudomonadota bacterium]